MTETEKLQEEIKKIQDLIEQTATKIAYLQNDLQTISNKKKDYNKALQILRDLK